MLLQAVAVFSQASKYMLPAGVQLGRRKLVKSLKLAEHCSVETKKRSEERFSFT